MSMRRVSPWLHKNTFINQILSELLKQILQIMQQFALCFFVIFILNGVFGCCWFWQRVSP